MRQETVSHVYVLQIVDNTGIPLFAFGAAFSRVCLYSVFEDGSMCGWIFEKIKQTQKRELGSIKLMKNVAWMRVGASKLVCNMGVDTLGQVDCPAYGTASARALIVLLRAGK